MFSREEEAKIRKEVGDLSIKIDNLSIKLFLMLNEASNVARKGEIAAQQDPNKIVRSKFANFSNSEPLLAKFLRDYFDSKKDAINTEQNDNAKKDAENAKKDADNAKQIDQFLKYAYLEMKLFLTEWNVCFELLKEFQLKEKILKEIQLKKAEAAAQALNEEASSQENTPSPSASEDSIGSSRTSVNLPNDFQKVAVVVVEPTIEKPAPAPFEPIASAKEQPTIVEPIVSDEDLDATIASVKDSMTTEVKPTNEKALANSEDRVSDHDASISRAQEVTRRLGKKFPSNENVGIPVLDGSPLPVPPPNVPAAQASPVADQQAAPINKHALILNAHIGVVNYRQLKGKHLCCFVRFFDGNRGERRASLYADALSGNYSEKQKLFILYALLTSNDGFRLQKEVVQSILIKPNLTKKQFEFAKSELQKMIYNIIATEYLTNLKKDPLEKMYFQHQIKNIQTQTNYATTSESSIKFGL